MDVTFDEDIALKKQRKCQLEETYEEVVAPRAAEPMKEFAPSPDNEILEEHDMLDPQEPPCMNISHKKMLAWFHDIIQEEEIYGGPEGSIRQSKKPSHFLVMWL